MRNKKLLITLAVILVIAIAATVCIVLLLPDTPKTSKPWNGAEDTLQDITYADGLVYFAAEPTVGYAKADIRTYTIMTEEEITAFRSNLSDRERGSTAFTSLIPQMLDCPLDLSFYLDGWNYVSFEQSLMYSGYTYYALTDTDLQLFRDLQKRAKTLRENSPIYTDTVTYRCMLAIPANAPIKDLPIGFLSDDLGLISEYTEIILTKSDRTFTFHVPFADSDGIAGTYTLTKDRLTLTATDGTDRTYVFAVKGYGFAFDKDASSALPLSETHVQIDFAPSVPDGAVFLPREFLFDLDGDGNKELVEFGDGGTSGIVSYRLWVSRNSIPVYNRFLPMMDSSYCYIDENGKLQNGKGVVMDLTVKDGELIFLHDGKEVDEFPRT